MMRFKLLLLLTSLSFIVALSSCSKEDEPNEVEIEIINPQENQVVSSVDLELHVRFRATGTLEDIAVQLYREGHESDLLVDVFIHLHAKEREIKEQIDLSSFPSGTTFVLHTRASLEHGLDVNSHLTNPEKWVIKNISFQTE